MGTRKYHEPAAFHSLDRRSRKKEIVAEESEIESETGQDRKRSEVSGVR